MTVTRRRFLGIGAGASLLAGCELTDSRVMQTTLRSVLRANDAVQGAIFSTNKLAPEYPREAITQPFPFNALYDEDKAPRIDNKTWQLELLGKIGKTAPWSIAQLAKLPQTSQITQLISVEGWSAIGQWRGPTLADFLQAVDADTTAAYVGFKCADDYYTSIDMAAALHPQTLLALEFMGQALTPKYGAPLRLRIPVKLGYKNPKHITAIYVTNDFPGGYWEDKGYGWFAGL